MTPAAEIEGRALLRRVYVLRNVLALRLADLERCIIQHRLYTSSDMRPAVAEARRLAEGLDALVTPPPEQPLVWPLRQMETP